ncbi:MAG: DUF547 domain-containing protein [Bdellovibrionales bacterium]|nr:DUF547 domain-containing protein [Bdellovibrionales bacterium]
MKKNILFSFLILAICNNAFAFDHKHTIYDKLLQKHVVENRVDYKSFLIDQNILQEYIQSFSKITTEEYKEWSRNEKLSFWINAYNALTIASILECYPIDSKICSSRWFNRMFYPNNSIQQIKNIWEKRFSISTSRLSLSEIEHEILRSSSRFSKEIPEHFRHTFHEPRIHFAINCGAVSCPRLYSRAYTSKNLERTLENQIKYFLSQRKNFRIREDIEQVKLSKIFSWFQEDFLYLEKKVPKQQQILSYIYAHWENPSVSKNDFLQYRIEYREYDWELNDIEAK